MQFAPQEGSESGWQAFYFSNARYRPFSVKLNGVKLEATDYNAWEHDDELPSAPYVFEITNYGGATIKFTVDDLLKAQDTGSQFTFYSKNGKLS